MDKKSKWLQESVLPGFKLTMGFTLGYLGLIVILPLLALFVKSTDFAFEDWLGVLSSPRLWAAARLSFGAAFLAALINVPVGLTVAWVLTRYEFRGRALLDMLVDLPIALPTAVAGIALTTAYSQNGMMGRWLSFLGINVVYTWIGVVVALVFVTFPFVVRTVQPVIKDLDLAVEEAAACLGARRGKIFYHVILPAIRPALFSGFTMAFARALGEYGSVVFISGNLPLKTEIAPFLIITKLEQYDYLGATAIGAILLVISFVMLILINRLAVRRKVSEQVV